MKLSDLVKSERYGIEGVIQEIKPCSHFGCTKRELTLDPKGTGLRIYYHEESFELVKPA